MMPAMAVVSADYVDVPVGALRMRTFVVAPRTPGPHPGIVFYSDIFQLTEPTLRWCTRLASYGFVVAAPEIYHRLEPAGTVLAFDDEGKARGQRDADLTPVADFDADAAAALDWLAQRTDGAPLGAAGHCTGGHLAFRAAFDARVRATVCWYPTGLHDGRLGADADAGSLARAHEIRGPLLLIFGTGDPHTPRAEREVIRRGLEGTDTTWVEYDAEHAFGRDVGPRFDPAVTDEAFARTVDHFRRAFS
jgi:carboxymethylenebutenolidase